MSKGILVLFFGPDGSGKTTLARLLKQKLEKDRLKVKISWMRGTHTISLILAFILSRFSNMRGEDNPYFRIRTPKPRKMWQLLEFISALPVILLKYKVPLFLGYIVIGERSYCDLIVWIAMVTKDPKFIASVPSLFLLRIASKGMNFYVTADAEILMKRRKGDVDRDFLLAQLVYYNLLSRLVGAIKIDTSNKKLSESVSELMSAIKSPSFT